MQAVKEDMMTFRDKNVLVVGLARSGAAAANLLSVLGAKVTVTDNRTIEELGHYPDDLSPSVSIVAGDQPIELFLSSDLIVISPGVPMKIPQIVEAVKKGVPVIGEMELAFLAVKSGHMQRTEFLGITGTNGKSTTSTLVSSMLNKAGFNAMLAGNIGNAISREILNMVDNSQLTVDRRDGRGDTGHAAVDYIVAEISSFQLESIREFRPMIAAILNITPDHLDRYESMDNYVLAKARIAENQAADDYIILNADDPIIAGKVVPFVRSQRGGGPRLLMFSRKRSVKGIYVDGNRIVLNLQGMAFRGRVFQEPVHLINTEEIRLTGTHNVENAMAASLMAIVAGCPLNTACNVLREFRGIEHRLEFVTRIRGVSFINDSKGTNVGAVAKSLEGLSNVILIMGGLDKHGDFSMLRNIVQKNVKLIILIGEAKDKIADALQGTAEIMKAGDIESAVRISLAKAASGDTVLLSPGCASFDMFENFEDRGRRFKAAVYKIKEGIN